MSSTEKQRNQSGGKSRKSDKTLSLIDFASFPSDENEKEKKKRTEDRPRAPSAVPLELRGLSLLLLIRPALLEACSALGDVRGGRARVVVFVVVVVVGGGCRLGGGRMKIESRGG